MPSKVGSRLSVSSWAPIAARSPVSSASPTRSATRRGDFLGAQTEFALHALAGIGSSAVEQRHVLGAVRQHQHGADGQRHHDGGYDRDGDVLALETDYCQ